MTHQQDRRGLAQGLQQRLEIVIDRPAIAGFGAGIGIAKTGAVIGQTAQPLGRQSGLHDRPVRRTAKGTMFTDDQQCAVCGPREHHAQAATADIDPLTLK